MLRNNIIIKQPSTFALLVDDISKMTPSEQKLLWIKLNKEKLSSLAKGIDSKSSSDNITDEKVAALVKKARKNGKKEKS